MSAWLEQEMSRIQSLNALPFIASWGIFAAAAVLSYFWQYLKIRRTQKANHAPALSLLGFIRFSLPFDKWVSRSGLIDIVMFAIFRVCIPFFAPLTTLVTIVTAKLVLTGLEAVFAAPQVMEITTSGLIISTILIFLVSDFASFFSHYLQHKIPALWELHKVHHSATFLTPITTYRTHPIGDVFDNFFGAVLVGISLGAMAYGFGLPLSYIIVLRFYLRLIGLTLGLDSLRHSHFPVSFGWFDRIFISPAMHQLHHSADLRHWDKNMGARLTIWDWMFRTAWLPKPGEKIVYGLGRGPAADAEQENVLNVTFMPIYRLFEVALKPSAEDRKPVRLRADTDEVT
jgi:sterol desaturase/sphingolipid hydroxylase (fatty acid hydroxylase superfamily)